MKVTKLYLGLLTIWTILEQNTALQDKIKRKKIRYGKNAAMLVIDKTHEIVRPIKTYEDWTVGIGAWKIEKGFKERVGTLSKDKCGLVVKQSGLHHVFSMVTYNNGFNGSTTIVSPPYQIKAGTRSLVQCNNLEKFKHHMDGNKKLIPRCFTSVTVPLKQGDVISLYSLKSNLVLETPSNLTYFGIVKIG